VAHTRSTSSKVGRTRQVRGPEEPTLLAHLECEIDDSIRSRLVWLRVVPGEPGLAGERNRGEPSGFANLAAPLMAAQMRKATMRDLRQLKSLMETRQSA
jgi:hypothetical protein